MSNLSNNCLIYTSFFRQLNEEFGLMYRSKANSKYDLLNVWRFLIVNMHISWLKMLTITLIVSRLIFTCKIVNSYYLKTSHWSLLMYEKVIMYILLWSLICESVSLYSKHLSQLTLYTFLFIHSFNACRCRSRSLTLLQNLLGKMVCLWFYFF